MAKDEKVSAEETAGFIQKYSISTGGFGRLCLVQCKYSIALFVNLEEKRRLDLWVRVLLLNHL